MRTCHVIPNDLQLRDMRLVLTRLVITSVLLTGFEMSAMTSADTLQAEDGDEREQSLQGDNPYMPAFLPTPSNVTFLTGQEAVLQCAIENRGTRTVVWRRSSDPNPLTIGQTTYVGDRRFHVSHGKHSLEWNLHIRHVTPNDSGVYECHVITKSRDIRQMILLIVDGTKYIPAHTPGIQISGSQFVEKGNTLTLSCNATGRDYPPDELDWFKDGLKLTNTPRLQLTKDVSLSERTIISTLQVWRATMGDAGTYVCRASDMQVTSAKVNILNTGTVNEKRDPSNHSIYGGDGPISTARCSADVSLASLLTSLFVYVITS